MRLFVSELLTAGGRLAGVDSSSALVREGNAMLVALLSDLLTMDNLQQVVTLWDAGLPIPLFLQASDVEFVRVDCAADEPRLFERCAVSADAVVVIAPEIGGALLQRRKKVAALGRRYLGASVEATELLADKFLLAGHLQRHQLATVPTELLSVDLIRQMVSDSSAFSSFIVPLPFEFPVVVKPRWGAGSWGVRLCENRAAFLEWLKTIDFTNDANVTNDSALSDYVVQPFVAGRAISVAAIVGGGEKNEGNSRCQIPRCEVLPIGEQFLSDDGRFGYLGGQLPAGLDDVVTAAVRQLVERCCRTISGLEGFIGFDLLLPNFTLPGSSENNATSATTTASPMIVEMNPRLTTSYLGYRELTSENLASRILLPDRHSSPICWREETVQFRPDGQRNVL